MRAVLVDVGDTLVHLDRPRDEVFQTNLEALHNYLTSQSIKFDAEKFNDIFIHIFNDATHQADLSNIEIPMEEIISKSLRKSGMSALEVDLPRKAMIEFYTPEVEAWQLYSDTVETLTELSKEYVMGVISNTKSDWFVRAILRRRGLDRFFNTVVTSAALKIRKPRQEIFTRALADLGVGPSEAVFMGDSIQADVRGAKNMGMYSIHVLRKPIDSTSLSRSDATATSLSEIPGIIAQWNNGSRRN